MITLKGAEVSAKIKEQVLAMNGKLGGYVPTAASISVTSVSNSAVRSLRKNSETRRRRDRISPESTS